jgi:23S rRNA pseudouridine1911/1915/1917 synthase
MKRTLSRCYIYTIVVFIDVQFVHHAGAFSPKRGTPRKNVGPQSSSLFAKPPPTAQFNLEALEAFEAQLYIGSAALSGHEEDDMDETDFELDDSVQEFVIPEELHNKRIDTVVAALIPELSRSVCGNLVADGMVRIGDNEVIDRKAYKVLQGTVIRVQLPRGEKQQEIEPQNFPLEIIYEDEYMVVLNKAAGMVVHPAAGNWDGTVVNALAYYLQSSPYGSGDFVGMDEGVSTSGPVEDATCADGAMGHFRPGIVHRLDKGTTGVLVVAKTSQALASLSDAFANRMTRKTYLAITVGNPGRDVTIDKPIGRHPIHRQRMRVVPDPHRKDSSGTAPRDRMSPTMMQKGRSALSFVDTMAFDSQLSLVQIRIETGRTHQIRVHLQDRHTPIYGDDIYGIPDWNKRLLKTHGIARPLLHAYCLEVDHPVTGERMVFKAPMAEDMKKLAATIWPQGRDDAPEFFI